MLSNHNVLITYHSPPEGVCIAGEVCLAVVADRVLLGKVYKVWWEDEAEEAYIQCGD